MPCFYRLLFDVAPRLRLESRGFDFAWLSSKQSSESSSSVFLVAWISLLAANDELLVSRVLGYWFGDFYFVLLDFVFTVATGFWEKAQAVALVNISSCSRGIKCQSENRAPS